MDISNIKLVVSDMDGTLLNSKHKVSQEFFDVFRKLKEKGIRFAVASGRQYYSLMERMEPIKDDMIFIAENGAIIMEKEKQLYIQPMDHDMILKVVEEIRKLGGKYLILCGRKQAYIESTDPEFMDPFLDHYEKYKVVEDITKVTDDVFLKLTVCDLSGAEKNTLPYIKHFEKDLQVKLSGKIWVDFNDKKAQKGNALKALQEIYNIDEEHTMVFGDFFNDMELFDHAAFSYAVDNAHPEVKKAAKFSTKSNDENGVEAILEELLEKISAKAEK